MAGSARGGLLWRSRLDPIGGQTLFGIDDIRQQLIDVAQQPDRPWIIAIDGLGGIGKTTIANEVAHHFVEGETFFNIGWVSAKQEEFLTETGLNDTGNPALSEASMTHLLLEQLMENPNLAASDDEKRLTLTHLLKEKPHLIFVDNLETMADQDALIPTLRHLVGPSKFVLTSRISLKAHSDVFCLSLSELTPTDSIRFLRHESTARGIAGLENASDEQLERIYEVVGGNPLALKLIIGQITYLPLGQVLENLIQAKGKQVDQFYTYLYWQAWNRLSEMERMLFLSMPLVPNATFSQLSLASELEFDDVQASLAKLISLSLILVAGDLEEPRYRLHRLTETFLMNEVLKWS
ncbi:MAG: NB-ARC domain-containing protein [Chloroflexota bacterium]